MKPILMMLCGLPGAGKSHYAKKISEENDFVIYSSDTIREELFGDINNQDNNEEVFKELHKKVKENLKNGKNVIYDACNISSKRRRAFLTELKKIPCKKLCVIVATPYEECIRANKLRDRIVPDEVIKKMYKSWNTPFFFEGWDELGIYYKQDTKLLRATDWLIEHMNYNQDNSHHTMTLGDHCLQVACNFTDNTLHYAGLLHDCGKPFTKSFRNSKGEISGEAHYYQHQCVGAYDSLFFKYPEDVDIFET